MMKSINVKTVIKAIIVIYLGITLVGAGVLLFTDNWRGHARVNEMKSNDNSYNKHGLSFEYPDGYRISNEKVSAGYISVLCESIESKWEQIECSVLTYPTDMFSSTAEKEEFCRETLEDLQQEYRKRYVIYKNARFGAIQKGILGKTTCAQMNIENISIYSEKYHGMAKIAFTENNKLICVVYLYKNANNKEILEGIEMTIKIQ